MNSFGITDRGAVRRDNQDSFLIERLDDKECVIAVLCDGMGGEKAGNIASDLATKTYASDLRDRITANKKRKPDIKAMMEQACNKANRMIYSYSCFDTDYTGMGTTMVSAVICRDAAYVLNVGDSRCYKITRKRMEQITRDHSLVQDMVDRGEISPEQARTHPRRNVITRALGVNELVPCDIFTPKLQRGDMLLLCSDGLTNMLEDKEIFALSRKNPDPLSLGRALMAEALRREARDNVTIVIISK
ncbi:MAG TPA: Stp1/IreP family PP2C-type Ser/Thr phosphatase [Candidatus Scatomorpha merdigallinarum]|nr:Stp1/IreP family PP2C-type Ser/Thr phosphatase [Candidatus Scatomorpha merdigallinarum]